MNQARTRASERRADIARKKRINRPAKNLQTGKSTVRAKAPRTIPPVMARAIYPGTVGKGSQAKRKVKRRFDVALNVPGAEIRLPSVPRVRLGWRLISFVLVAALGFVIYQSFSAPQFLVQDAEVNGLRRISKDEVNAALNLSGKPVFMVNPETMKQDLLNAFAEFTAISYKVELPNTIVLTVTERVPVLIWRQNGQAQLIDREGVAFPLRNEALEMTKYPVVEASQSPLPTVTQAKDDFAQDGSQAETSPKITNRTGSSDASAKPLLPPDMVSSIVEVAKQAPDGSTLLFDNLHGFGWRDRRGWIVYLGELKDFSVKLNIYKSILANLRKEEQTPILISVEYVHAPFYRVQEQQ